MVMRSIADGCCDWKKITGSTAQLLLFFWSASWPKDWWADNGRFSMRSSISTWATEYSGSGSSEKQQQQKLTVINYTCYACLEMLEHAPYVGGPTSFVTIFIGYLQQEPQHLWSKRLCLRIHALKIWIKIFVHWGSHLTEVLYTGTATHSAKVKLARPTLQIDDSYTPNSHKRQPKQQWIKTKLQQQRKNERKRSERSQ